LKKKKLLLKARRRRANGTQIQKERKMSERKEPLFNHGLPEGRKLGTTSETTGERSDSFGTGGRSKDFAAKGKELEGERKIRLAS